MKTASPIGRSLQVFALALCGLSFYVLLFALLFLIVGLVLSAHIHV